MPLFNTQPTLSPSASRNSPLQRAKSLRLPSNRERDSSVGPPAGTLTRHGSIRFPRSASTTAAANAALSSSSTSSSNPTQAGRKLNPLSVFKRPLLKQKPAPQNTVKVTGDVREKGGATKTNAPAKGTVSGKPPLKGGEATSQDSNHESKTLSTISETSLHSRDSPTNISGERTNSRGATSPWSSDSGSTPNLVAHLRRLTEEHEKLQIEYARLRLQVLENASHSTTAPCHPKDVPQVIVGDQAIPSPKSEGSESPSSSEHQSKEEDRIRHLESLVQGYHGEVLRLQDELRKAQKRYWEQVMNAESVDAEVEDASLQIVNLSDKLDERTKELNDARSHIRELEGHLLICRQQLKQCRSELQDTQLDLDEACHQREVLRRQVKDLKADVMEAKESVEFLQAERNTFAEALQETEQALATTKAEMDRDKTVLKDLAERCRRLYTKVQDKGLQLQLLQTELDATQGRARDMLLSQGAQLTMGMLALSQLSFRIHSILTSVFEFAATQLGLDQEVLDEMCIDLDDDDQKADSVFGDQDDLHLYVQPVENGSESALTTEQENEEKQLKVPELDLPNGAISPTFVKRPTSLVQAIIHAIEQTARAQNEIPQKRNSVSSNGIMEEPSPDFSQINGEFTPDQLSAQTTPVSQEIDLEKTDLSALKDEVGRNAVKPIGMATQFRPANNKNEEVSKQGEMVMNAVNTESSLDDLDDNSTSRTQHSLEDQVKQINNLLSKLVTVLRLIQEKYKTNIKALEEKNKLLQEEVNKAQSERNKLADDLSIKEDMLERTTSKLNDYSEKLSKESEQHLTETTKLHQELVEMKERNRCLEATNAEQARQLKEELSHIVDSSNKASELGYAFDAETICDKLAMKQEIMKLKETIASKEEMLQAMASKFSRNKKTWEENHAKAEADIQRLDSLVDKVIETLQDIPDVVNSCEALKSIWLLLGGDAIDAKKEGISTCMDSNQKVTSLSSTSIVTTSSKSVVT